MALTTKKRSAERIAGGGGAKPPASKRQRRTKMAQQVGSKAEKNAIVPLQRPKEPAGKPWPLRDLQAFDIPGDCSWGPMLGDVLKERGWKFSYDPCRTKKSDVVGEDDYRTTTVFMKEFEATLRGQAPAKLFGKKGAVQEGHRLRTLKLPKKALWMMGFASFRVPDTACGRDIWRDDFAKTMLKFGGCLPGKPGDYRMAQFPGMEVALYKTSISKAFREKSWYPIAYILPQEKALLARELRKGGSKYWIGKPRNASKGDGIRVWRGDDPELVKLVRGCEKQPKQVVQRYLADPLLVGGYKFHMRIHLAITSFSPLRAYVQENGQCLFATKPYTLSGKTMGSAFDPPVHVTNMGLNAIPKNKENYMREKPVIGKGQQLRMRELEAYLEANHRSYSKEALWSQICRIAADTTRYLAKAPAAQGNKQPRPDQHFEVFGMDLMLDKNLKVWMCETNSGPGLDYPDKKVLGSPNPDYGKEVKACTQTIHDLFTLMGLDAGRPQPKGSLKSWYELDFEKM